MNACGIDDFHDGVNYTRTACVIAVSKARDMFEPFLHQARSPHFTPSISYVGISGNISLYLIRSTACTSLGQAENYSCL